MKSYVAKLTCFILTTLTLIVIPSAISGTLLGPDSSTTGNYTISSTGNFCTDPLMSYRLLENNQTVQSNCTISQSFYDKPTGVYNYTLLECEYDPEVNYSFCAQVHSRAVTVSRDNTTNPNDDTEVRLGDYNNDGLTDIFVKSSITAPYILKQTPYNSFQLISGITTTQISQYSNWGIASQILAYVSDLNVDGTKDMMLIGINSHISAANDQIIYSQYNANTNTTPTSISTMSTSKRRFLVETLGLSQDRAYLLRTMLNDNAYSLVSQGFVYAYFNTAYLQLFQMGQNGNIYMPTNENPYDDTTQPSACIFYSCQFDTVGGQWQMYVYAEVIDITWDFSIFHQSTVSLAQEIDKLEDGTSTLDNLLNIFESQLGYVSWNDIADNQVDVFDNVHSFHYFKTNTCTFAVLARYLNSMSIKEAIEAGNKRIQFRGRKLLTLWFHSIYHAAISIMSPTIETVSAMPADTATILKGRLNEPADEPDNTLLVGFVNTSEAPEIAFAKLQNAVVFYNNTAPLAYDPDPFPFTASYNSNGFAKGLVDLVGTVQSIGPYGAPGMENVVNVTIDSASFPGLFKPVPKSKFGY